MLSTSSHQKDIDYCREAGADAYLVKPLELDDWETKVASLVEFWLRSARAAHSSDDATQSAPLAIDEVGHTIIKKASSRCGPEHVAVLTRAIEQEIIPRLLLAHASDVAVDVKATRIAPCKDDVAELARLVMEDDVGAAAAYVAKKRAKGTSLESVFVAFIAPAARLVGDLWKADLCSFDQFSRALLRLQEVLAELNPAAEAETLH